MELKDTIELMQSKEYKDRFLAEYYQVVIRATKLRDMVIKYKKGELNFKPTCPVSVLEQQLKIMEAYTDLLESRAIIENIKIPDSMKYINCVGIGFVK